MCGSYCLQGDLINKFYQGELHDYVKCLEVSVLLHMHTNNLMHRKNTHCTKHIHTNTAKITYLVVCLLIYSLVYRIVL